MLTCLFQDKCAPYFPDPVECPQTLPTEYTDIGIGVKLSERLNKGTYIRREYSIYNRKVRMCMFMIATGLEGQAYKVILRLRHYFSAFIVAPTPLIGRCM